MTIAKLIPGDTLNSKCPLPFDLRGSQEYGNDLPQDFGLGINREVGLCDQSEPYREKWFEFKKNRMIEWVKKLIERGDQ
jgi:hypothetical protein